MKKSFLLALIAGLLASMVVWLGLRGDSGSIDASFVELRDVGSDAGADAPQVAPEAADEVVSKRSDILWTLNDFEDLELSVAEGEDEELKEAESSALGTLQGRLIWDRSWQPIEGAKVSLTSARLDTVVATSEKPDGRLLHAAQAETDANGNFELDRVLTFEQFYLLIEKHSLRAMRKVRWSPTIGETVDLGVFYLDRRGGVIGRVIDAEGNPVEGVRVRGVDDPLRQGESMSESTREGQLAGAERFDPQGTMRGDDVPRWMRMRDGILPFPEFETGESGRFELRGLQTGSVDLVLQLSGRVGRRADCIIAAENTTDLGDVVLPPGRRFDVRVIGREKDPVTGVQVSARPEDWLFGPEGTVTDARGMASVWLPEDVEFAEVQVRAADGRPWISKGSHRVDRVAEVFYSDWRMRLGAKVQLRSLADELVEDAKVVIKPGRVGRAVNDGPGEWTVETRPLGYRERRLDKATMVAVAPGYAPAVSGLPPRATLPNMQEPPLPSGHRVVRFVPAFSVNFFVTDIDGDPVEGARVFATPQKSSTYHHAGASWERLTKPIALGRTDESGMLVARGMWASEMVFTARHLGFGHAKLDKMIPSAGITVPLRLTAPPRLRGFLSDGGVRPPSRRYDIVAVPELPNHGDSVSTVADLDGAFEFAKLSPGKWRVFAREPSPTISARQASGPFGSVRRMPPPVAMTSVVLSRGETRYIDLQIGSTARLDPDLNGFARIDGQPAVGAMIRLDMALRPPRIRDYLKSYRARMPKGARLPKRVRELLSGTASETKQYEAYVEADGSYAFEGLPSYYYSVRPVLRIQSEGRWFDFDALEIEPKTKLGERFDFVVTTGQFEIALFDHQGRSLAGRMVRLNRVDAPAPKMRLVADQIGYLRFARGVPVGRYSVAIDGLEFADAEFDVTAGGVTVKELYATGLSPARKR